MMNNNIIYLYERTIFFKRATEFDGDGEELMKEIHRCCEDGTGDFSKIHTSRPSNPIRTDLRFQPLEIDIKNNIKLKDITIPKFIFDTVLILGMNCGPLNKELLTTHFYMDDNCSLLKFILNTDEGTIKLDTILVFTFNSNTRSIEVLSFCCDTKGGGVIFNFLINAVKCGLKMSTPDKYNREIILTALDEAIPFYEKYDLEKDISDKPNQLRRLLTGESVASAESTDTTETRETTETRGRPEEPGLRPTSSELRDRSRSRSRSREKGKKEVLLAEFQKEKMPKKIGNRYVLVIDNYSFMTNISNCIILLRGKTLTLYFEIVRFGRFPIMF